jgi:prolyl-tRNA synthetase
MGGTIGRKMKYSKLFGKTSKTEGSDYKIDSHRLLTQAGFIRESAAGRYYLMPLGQKVHDKIVEIVRKHMNKYGAQEISMPVLHPIELWKETNRTSTTGFELMKVEDRREAEFALGGTAEEMAVDLVRKFNISYKDLPFNIYQFSMKFRDELRARGGLLRVREFVMKDAYSFSTEEQFKKIYEDMGKAYTDICEEIGLQTEKVAADNGYIGGEYCHEFIVESDIGESRYLIDKKTKKAAHEDVAQFIKHDDSSDEPMQPREDVEGKGMIGVKELAKFLNIPVEKTTKTILFETEKGKVVAAGLSGLYDVNLTKLQHVVGGSPLHLASAETVKRVTGAEVGYAGIIDLPEEVKVILDDSMKGRRNFECGANRTNYHSINVNFGRDFPEPENFYDIAMAKEGMKSLEGNELGEKRGIEVGNIFQLGYHYSNLMKDAEYTNDHGKRQKYYMGCYGFGIGRTMAAVVEKYHDKNGIIWPEDIAPYKVYLAVFGADKKVLETAEKLYQKLQESGIEVLFDDRDSRAGEKFADADLIGCPHRVVVSKKSLEAGGVEYKKRNSDKIQIIKTDELHKQLAS